MLQSMRQSAKSWIMMILFGFLILSFAIWGIGDIFRGGGRDAAVLEVGGAEVSRTAFVREYQRELEGLRQRFGGRISAETLNQLGLGQQVAAQMAQRLLFDLAADDLGILIPDEAVAAVVRADPNFQAGPGGFNPLQYERAVAASGFTVAGYEARLREDLGRERLIGAVTAANPAPKALADRIYQYRSERRVLQVVRVPAAPDAVADPDQATLEPWYKEHTQQFMAPEYRAITAIVMRPEDLMAEIQIPEERLREAYENRQDEFIIRERRTASQLLYQEEEAARQAHELVAAGKPLEEAATTTGNAQGVISLGTLTRNQFFPEIVDAIFAVQEGGVTAPLRSPVGWHIVKVTEVEPGRTKAFEEVRDELAQELKRERVIEQLYELMTSVEDELAGGATMEEAANRLNLKTVKTEAVDAQGKGPDSEPVQGLPQEPEFLQTAFQTEEGFESDMVETGSGVAFILQVDKVTPPAARPLDEVRDEAIAAWKEEQAREKARATAEEIADAVKGGTPMEKAATDRKLEARTTKPVSRDGTGPDQPLPRPLVGEAFGTKPGGVAVGAEGGDAIVVQVEKIMGGDPEAETETRQRIAEELAARIDNDLLAQYSAALEQRYPVEIKSGVIDQAVQAGVP